MIQRIAISNSGDDARIAMDERFRSAFKFMDEDPDMALDLLSQSRLIAQELDEKWWVQLSNHWELQTLLFYKRDYNHVLEKAVKAAVEVRKPEYENFPQRICLHEDLIYSYLESDPIGYSEQIRSAIEYMESQVTPDLECRFCVSGLKTHFTILTGDIDLALDLALKYVEQSEHEDHYLSSAYIYLCAIAFARQDWQKMKDWALAGEVVSRRRNRENNLVEMLTCNAVATRCLGDEKEALRLCQAATQRAAGYGARLGARYYQMLAAYHELGGDLKKACQVRDRQLHEIEGTARHFVECQCRLEIVRLRKALGLPFEDAADGVRTAAKRLKEPSYILKQLESYLDHDV
ncbi:MAG: hypothetical protein JXB07_11140 [Anaerolineae bacterium]|nr:hypothetical protein [Anaerolineae bacterium]